MAAGVLQPPGTEDGPCKACKHTDCIQTRAMAAMPCLICNEPIGYDTRFYQSNDWTMLTHALCEEKKIEQQERADRIKARIGSLSEAPKL